MSEAGGDVAVSGESEQADRGIAQGGHGLRRRPGAYLGSVLVAGDVADPVQRGLDAQWPWTQAASVVGGAPVIGKEEMT